MSKYRFLQLFLIMIYVTTTRGAQVKSQSFQVCSRKDAQLTQVIGLHNTRSAIACAAKCLQNTLCKSATYTKGDSTCILSNYGFGNLACDTMTENENTDMIFIPQQCYYDMPFVNGKCQCASGYLGTLCETRAKDCVDHGTNGYKVIYPFKDTTQAGITAFCLSSTGTRIFQGKGDSFLQMANANWDDFKNGFGHPSHEQYWMGNKYVHALMGDSTSNFELIFTVTNTGSLAFWHYYKNAYITDEADNYTLHYGQYIGVTNEQDKLQNNAPFRTFDHNDNGCVSTHGAPFWYLDSCIVPSVMSGNYSWSGSIEPIKAFNAYIRR